MPTLSSSRRGFFSFRACRLLDERSQPEGRFIFLRSKSEDSTSYPSCPPPSPRAFFLATACFFRFLVYLPLCYQRRIPNHHTRRSRICSLPRPQLYNPQPPSTRTHLNGGQVRVPRFGADQVRPRKPLPPPLRTRGARDHLWRQSASICAGENLEPFPMHSSRWRSSRGGQP